MRNGSWIVVLLILLGLTICVPIPVVSVEPVPPVVPTSGTFEKYGPRIDDLVFVVGYDIDDFVYWGNIDLMDIPVPHEYVSPWLSDLEITMGNYSEWGWYQYDLNNQMWPVGHGTMVPPGWNGTEPAVVTGHYWQNYTEDGADFCQRCYDSRQFRRALAHLIDRASMITNLEGSAEPMETFIFPAIADWENPDAPKYAYSLALAEQALIHGGFQDWDGDNILEYSPSNGTVPDDYEELPTLMGWIRSDDPDRTFAGELIKNGLVGLGIPQNLVIADRATCYYHAWVAYDYHVYTGGWSWDRQPDMYYHLFHSEKDTYPSSGADNYVRYHNKEYDKLAEGLKTAATVEEAKFYCDACQMMLHRDAACIPLYAHVGYVAHRTNYGAHPGEGAYAGKKWEGFVNELGVGFPSFWTYLNAHPQGFAKGGTLRQGLLVDIEKWSPVHAEWFYDWLILGQIYESLISYHPYNVTKYVPALSRTLPEILTWTLDGETCTRLRFTPDPQALWHDETPVSLDDIGFSFTYMRDEVSVPHYWAVQNVYGFLTADNASNPDWDPLPSAGEIDILYNVESWLALEWAVNVPIIPKHIWEGKDSWTWNPEDHDAVIGTGPFMCKKDGVVGRVDRVPGVYVHLVANPNYFRKYIWPDTCDVGGTVGRDEFVGVFDHGVVACPGHIFTYDPRLYPDLPAWPVSWIVDGDQYLDVTKDGRINAADLLEIAVHFGEPWPPPWYADC